MEVTEQKKASKLSIPEGFLVGVLLFGNSDGGCCQCGWERAEYLGLLV